ncbi:type II secretion system protein [Roseibacillus ishigakijimensis]|uniref:Type II secretion system protein n=1 Tax=Roseibacillus ishigakijimensis TaxID=454146 RepID=A0A934RRL6_9BACT|nr:type II secretion system protein [Roseibacillus ishigakijimensis]MBK1833256.1 type II secretion system protein [Roseibacillus ishigakijimensis]
MKNHSRSGFTLMETLLAIAVVAVLLTTFLAVFGPATSGISRAISVQDADRLASALEKELSTLREDETGQYQTAFDKAFEWISSSGSLDSAVILFNYRGDTAQITDGRLEPYTNTQGSPGQDYLVQSAVRRLGGGDSDLEQLMEAVEGKVFVVRMRQLVRDADGGLVAAEAGEGLVSAEGNSASNADSFEDAVIPFQADFYQLPANSYQYVSGPLSKGGSDFEGTLGSPLFSRSMAVRR